MTCRRRHAGRSVVMLVADDGEPRGRKIAECSADEVAGLLENVRFKDVGDILFERSDILATFTDARVTASEWL